MAPAAHTTETPSEANLDNGAGITLGVRFTVDEELEIAAVAFYAPTTNSGTYTAGVWETTTDDDPNGSGTGTLIESGSVGSGSVTPGAWNDVPLDAPVTCSPGAVYTAGVHTSSGRFVRTQSFYSSASLTGGGVTLLQAGTDPNPPGLGSMVNGVFTEGAALAYPASQFTFADYFIDVAVDEGGQVLAISTAAETDAAVAVGRAKARTVGTATETDAAQPVGRAKTRAVATAAATEQALPIGRVKSRAIGTTTETSTAVAVGRTKRRTVGTAAETDTALPVGSDGGAPAVPAVFRAGAPELGWAVGPPALTWTVGAVEV